MNEKIVHPEDMEAGLAFGWDLCGMGIVSLVRTHLGAAEITRLYQELAESTGDFLPVVVQDLDEGGCGLNRIRYCSVTGGRLRWRKASKVYQTQAPYICPMSALTKCRGKK